MSDWFNVSVNVRVEADSGRDAERKVAALLSTALQLPGARDEFRDEAVNLDSLSVGGSWSATGSGRTLQPSDSSGIVGPVPDGE